MQGFDVADFLGYLDNWFLLGGVLVTVGLTAATIVGGLIFGMSLALLRMSGRWHLEAVARFYIWIFRGTPLLIQLVIVYTGLPQIGLQGSEIIRSGFMGVPPGQREAAIALGLPSWLVVWKVTLPQAFRVMIPPLGNSVNSLLKATSLTSVISMEELMRRSQMLMQYKFDVLEAFSAAAVFYLLLTTLWGFVQRRLEIRFGCDPAPIAER